MTDALRDAAQHALDVLEQVTRHFTRTPSTLADSTTRGNAHAAMHALRAALAAPPVAPGWVLVPKEPTPAMLAAAERDLDRHVWTRLDGRLWSAMLAAAPGAPDALEGTP